MTDDEKATAVVDALRGVRETMLICSVFVDFAEYCNGRLRGIVGEQLFCGRCGQVYDITAVAGSTLWVHHSTRPMTVIGIRRVHRAWIATT